MHVSFVELTVIVIVLLARLTHIFTAVILVFVRLLIQLTGKLAVFVAWPISIFVVPIDGILSVLLNAIERIESSVIHW